MYENEILAINFIMFNNFREASKKSIEFSILSWVGVFEKVILFWILNCGWRKKVIITVVSILLSRTSLLQIFNKSDCISICEPKMRFKVLIIPSLACCLNRWAKKSVRQFIVPSVPSLDMSLLFSLTFCSSYTFDIFWLSLV